MALIAVPNVSEGRKIGALTRFRSAIESEGSRVLDLHSDALHNRSVFTLAGSKESLISSSAALAKACLEINLEAQEGLHPRLGGLDVCPFVPVDTDMGEAIAAARTAAERIAQTALVPVYLYEAAATRPECRSLPSLRKGGLEELARRALKDLPPEFGPKRIDMQRGVVCVGARRPLIAFNVQLRCDADVAKTIAGTTRSSGGGPPGIRALGWGFGPHLSQISMNLIRPEEVGIDDAFACVSEQASKLGVPVVGTEIVGLPLERFMPDPNKEAARLLVRPGRSLETALRS